ncbi:unnamed protein product [Acanthoscelides obtectus]|uniref:HTH psq-type domain-containing protein n=1 Tax=Acanthoscelides obtectus TaxID=200917 RepID=A0A9P0QBV5_ACAOB|nr:unnamed protein product [Acanthoscelides obtectus]CAK1646012.1 hypothetical protein AOBTE_LOCUS14395 [Acanthoscelides obtectus]
MGINEAAKAFGIPKTTFKRRLKANNTDKNDRLGPDCSLGSNAELKIVNHIKKLQKAGFAPIRTEVKIMAFNLGQLMGIPNKFNQKEGKAGQKWLELCLKRRSEVSIRKSENTSIARALGMSRETVGKYFSDLERIMTEHNFYDKPGHIFDTDETGLQLNTRAGQVLAEKSSKCVPSVSPGEKGETISVIACCSAEGIFLPPYCIFKGKNRKED